MTEEFKALDENVIIESKNVARAGEEIKSDSGFIIGKRELPEVPLTGEVISAGRGVPIDAIKIGQIVLLPPGSMMMNVPDPRFLRGEIKQSESRNMCVTHWKNIKVKYDI